MENLASASFEEIDRAFEDPGRHKGLQDALGEDEFEEILDIRRRPQPFGVTGNLRRLVILPGIMGSVLSDIAGMGDLWPSLQLLTGGLQFSAMELNSVGEKDLFEGVIVKARALIPFFYYKAFAYFRNKKYLVTQFPFDWRRRIDSSALAFKEYLDTLLGADEKAYLIAHSMGGLVARRYFDLFPDHAQAHAEHLFMLGTPNHGSYAPPMAFSGKHSIVSAVGWILGGAEISRGVVASFPGMYEMFPSKGTFGPPELYESRIFPGGVSGAHLQGALTFQDRLTAANPEKMTVFATQSEKTVVSAHIEPSGEHKYFAAKAGDGTVPVQSAFIPGIKTFLSSRSHSNIPRETEVLEAIQDLIRTGACDLPEYQPRFGLSKLELEEVPAGAPAFEL